MTVEIKDPFSRLAQTAAARRFALVSVTGVNQDNTYAAKVLSLNYDGEISVQTGKSITFRNLAEASDGGGKLADGQNLLVVEFQGQWVTYQPANMTWFMGRVEWSGGSNIYLVREQVFSVSAGDFIACPNSSQIAASNIQELQTAATTPVANNTLVKVFCVADDSSPTNLEYFFDYPV